MEKSVCFIGHRKINDTPELHKRLVNIISELLNDGITNYIFGDHSEFNDICYDIVTEFKKAYPQIKRINFRTNYENADSYTMRFLISGYEESIFPNGVSGSGKASYVKRNAAMISESEVCVFYYNKGYLPPKRKHNKKCVDEYQPKSGTALAYKYALSMKKRIINCF